VFPLPPPAGICGTLTAGGLCAVAWWFDPRTGAATRTESSFATTGPTTFTPPASGPESDWVLVIDDESKDFAAPGAKH
jgi:hypothetical protein